MLSGDETTSEYLGTLLPSPGKDLTSSDSLRSGRIAKSIQGAAGSRILEDTSSNIHFLEHSFDMVAAVHLRQLNPFHSAALELVPDLIIGEGVENSQVEDVLSPLCGSGDFEEEITAVADGRNECGFGVLEVVREPGNMGDNAPIAGIHSLKPEYCYLARPSVADFATRPDLLGLAVAENLTTANTTGSITIHGEDSSPIAYKPSGMGRLHAPFGKRSQFFEAHGIDDPLLKASTAEYIIFPRRGTLLQGYPLPRWLAAAAYIELNLMAMQYGSDFYANSGAPAFFLFALGGGVPRVAWQEMQNDIATMHTGLGNRFRGLMANLPGKDLKIQLEQLETPSPAEGFPEFSTELGTAILAAHGIPPRLAGVMLSQKIGSSNSTSVEALYLEETRIRKDRRMLSRRLAMTLGNPECNGGLGLTPQSFLVGEHGAAFRSAWSPEKIQMLYSQERQSDPVGSGRDPSAGAAQSAGERSSQSS